ncbi:MAG: hypothetical protein IPL23_26235 [Saprospiraceae bacterium]|nr:hypothetical protein [Saprospiraceae bacterium]
MVLHLFRWGVGYPSFTYDIGEITSPNVEVTSLRNTNAFSILLRVERRTNEMGLPDDVAQILLPPGANVSDFNGQLNGNWIAITDPPPPIIMIAVAIQVILLWIQIQILQSSLYHPRSIWNGH